MPEEPEEGNMDQSEQAHKDDASPLTSTLQRIEHVDVEQTAVHEKETDCDSDTNPTNQEGNEIRSDIQQVGLNVISKICSSSALTVDLCLQLLSTIRYISMYLQPCWL